MSGNHDHGEVDPDQKLKIGLVLNTCFAIFQFTAGTLTGSLALISDASHNITDTLSILISLFANRISRWEANPDKTYGYKRATILAAILNALIIVVVAVFIFFEAYRRIQHPPAVPGHIIAIVAAIGILVNGCIAWMFRKGSSDLNIQSVFFDMAADTVASAATVVAGIAISLTGQTIIDPLLGVAIGIMLLWGAWRILRKGINTLLEGVPEGINLEEIKGVLQSFPHITGVDDLHIWALSSRYFALSCHVVLEDCNITESTKLVREMKEALHEKFKIEHATIETELVGCEPEH